MITFIFFYIYLNIFRHVTHFAWNANSKELELEKIDPHLRMFLDKVGVSECQFRNQDTRDFIYDFIEKHGGMNAIREDINSSIPKLMHNNNCNSKYDNLQQHFKDRNILLQFLQEQYLFVYFFIIILLVVILCYYTK